MRESRSILFATILSLLFLLVWEYFISKPQRIGNEADSTPHGIEITQEAEFEIQDSISLVDSGGEGLIENFQNIPKLLIEGGSVAGSIDLIGFKINNLGLNKYMQEQNESEDVKLFMPSDLGSSYYTEFGFLSSDQDLVLPNSKTLWQSDRDVLHSGQTAILRWVSSQNIEFRIHIALDENYMFTVKQEVVNRSKLPIRYNNYGLITRTHIETKSRSNMMVHEGGIAVLDSTLKEYKFKDIAKRGKIDIANESGWIGFSDKYWLSALIPQNLDFNGKFARFYNKSTNKERFQADFISGAVNLKPGASYSSETLLFAGAKELKLIEDYKHRYSIPLFDRSVDFGWLYFITKPIFLLLNYFYSLTSNFGYAILVLTLFIKALLFPLAYKGFKGMNRLKDLQPKMAELKKRYKDKPQEFQKALMELYKKEKVNPISGCLPLLLQMPVFFALYKVLYVNIEMRQAYFFGWIKDLSAPDPTSIFNLFGLVPMDLPSFLHIGVLPILMSLSMYLQQRLSPQPTDPTQAMVMKFLPLIFLVMFASFPSGLLLYITFSNILSIAQQVAIKKFVR